MPEKDTLLLAEGVCRDSSSVAPSWLSNLALTNFRNYAQLSLSLLSQPIVLTGPNGAGKTNILEAVSLLAPGRGIRRAQLAAIDRTMADGQANPLPLPWSVTAQFEKNAETIQIATGRDAEAAITGIERRLFRLDGAAVNQQALVETLSIVWLTPQLDQLFQEGQSARRKFFDRLSYGFEPSHAFHVSAYESAMRERNQLLQDRRNDKAWFTAIEQKMAEHAVVVAAHRLQLLERLNAVIALSQCSFPKPRLELKGCVEDLLAEGFSSLMAEERFREMLAQKRVEDGYAGRTGEGIHRSELFVYHPEKQREAANCSTGEQKAMLLSILLAVTRGKSLWGGGAPILLLDEIVAHLDLRRRAELAEEIADTGVQAWLTGTDAETFGDWRGKAQFLQVDDGTVYPFT